jgi:hypothetical protein
MEIFYTKNRCGGNEELNKSAEPAVAGVMQGCGRAAAGLRQQGCTPFCGGPPRTAQRAMPTKK